MFGLIPDQFDEDTLTTMETVRLIDYSGVVDSKTKKIMKIADAKALINNG